MSELKTSEFTGKAAIVTGGARGIGRATAKLLASEGIQTVVADIAQEDGHKTVSEIEEAGGTASFVPADLSRHEVIRDVVEKTVSRYGRLDYVVHSAYTATFANAEELAEEDWDRGMAVMLKAVYLLAKYAFPAMREAGGGAMVNIASVHGLASHRRYGVYAAAKAGVINLTRNLALDYGKDNIRVNALCPGWIITEGSPGKEEAIRRASPIYALGRPGRPEEMATVIRFLLSRDASFVTGHAMIADGGLTAQLPDSAARVAQQALENILNEES